MNGAMADAFDLGWKLASVMQGQADPKLLHTCSRERRAKALEPIGCYHDMATLFSARPKAGTDGADPAKFQRYFAKHGRYTAGVENCGESSSIQGGASHQHLATVMVIGKRFHSAPVVRLADAKPLQRGTLSTPMGAGGCSRLQARASRC